MEKNAAITAWDLSETQRLIEHPAVRLLRSPNAAFTLTFLHRAFKEHQAISVPESQLRARLDNFLEEARALKPEAYAQTGAGYLAAWCDTEHLLLKKLYSDEAEEPVFELTNAAERAMQWVEDLQVRAFVGAESRLELIVRQLEEIVLFSTTDAEKRVTALREQQALLQTQIDSIESTRTAQAYTAVQLTERFANALDLARGLASDFRQLEENFKEVARSLAEAQSRPGTTKGRMVSQLLDTHAALRNSAQGQSFYAFWNMLSSPERQQRWRELIHHVYRLDGIDPELRRNNLLARLSSRLLVEAERVVRSNERMAATLRRALESSVSGEDQRLRELIREIQQSALACQHSPPPEDGFFDLAGPPHVFDAFSRTFWEPESAGHASNTIAFEGNVLDLEMVNRFRALADLNLGRLREKVALCLVTSDSVLLSQVLDRFPPRDGVIEVVGYIVVGMQDPQHYVPGDDLTEIRLGPAGDSELWQVPQVLFFRTQS